MDGNKRGGATVCGRDFALPVGQGEDTPASFAAVDMPEPINMANCIQHWTREKLLPGDIANACCSDLLLIHMRLWIVSGDFRQLGTVATSKFLRDRREKS